MAGKGAVSEGQYESLMEKAAKMELLSKTDSALHYYNQIIDLPLDKAQLATTHLNIGDAYRKLSEFKSVEHHIFKFDSIYQADQLTDSLLIAKRDYLYGKLLSNKGAFDQAMPYFNNTIRLKNKLLGEQSPELARIYNFKGINLYFLGEYDLALQEYRRAHRVCIINEMYNIDLADILQNKAIIYTILGEFDSAYLAIDQSRNIRETIFSPNSLQLGTFYLNYGHFLNVIGDLNRSLQFNYKAEDIFNQQDRSDPISLGYLYINIGNILQLKGDLEKARVYFNQAIAKLGPIIGESHPTTVSAYINLGSIYVLQGEYQRAKSVYRKQKDEQIDVNFLIKLYRNLARLYDMTDQSDSSKYYFDHAIQFAKSNFGEHHYETAKSIAGLADFLMEHGNSLEAINLYEEAVSIFSHNYGKTDHEVGYTMVNLARCYHNTGQYQVADSLFSIADNIFRDEIESLLNWNQSNRHVTDIRIINYFAYRASLFLDWHEEDENTDKLQKSLELLSQGIELVEKLGLGIADESRILLNQSVRQMLADALDVCYALEEHTGEGAYIDTAFNFAGRSKAAVLLSSIRKLNALRAGGVPELVTNAERDINEQIASVRKLIFDEQQQRYPNHDRITYLESRHFGLMRQYDSLVQFIEHHYEDYFALRYDNRVSSLTDVMQNLDADEVLLEYVLAGSNLFIFQISSDQFNLFRSENGAVIIADIKAILEQTKLDFLTQGSEEYDAFMSASHNLYSELIAPFSDVIENKHLIIIPDGLLNYLPFEILLESYPENISRLDYNNLPYLLFKNPVSYSYSTTLKLEDSRHLQKGGRKLLAFVPEYDSTPFENLMDEDRSDQYQLVPLPFALQEATNVRSSFGGDILRGTEASKKNFLKYAPENDILHLAMHAQINEINPLYSKLFFHPVSDSVDHYALNTYELYGMELNAQLVVLSACNTGAGQLAQGEGVMSLTRGFIYAGAPSIVMTNWEVHDETGSYIMKHFYENLNKGYPKDYALQQAKVSFLREANQLKSHPYFWSAYILVGDASPLVDSSMSLKWIAFVIGALLSGVLILIIRNKKKRKY